MKTRLQTALDAVSNMDSDEPTTRPGTIGGIDRLRVSLKVLGIREPQFPRRDEALIQQAIMERTRRAWAVIGPDGVAEVIRGMGLSNAAHLEPRHHAVYLKRLSMAVREATLSWPVAGSC